MFFLTKVSTWISAVLRKRLTFVLCHGDMLHFQLLGRIRILETVVISEKEVGWKVLILSWWNLLGGVDKSRWHAVASWTWDAQDETCGICRMAFDGCCPDCKLPGDDCPLIWGVCNHAFHLHCILKWVNSQTSQAHCPMCRREWQFKG
ncbi:Anaphase-promoting complex subunit 11 [Glycine soja]|uniref:Anaphase-promoting complex subunit 11 n=1 Tax=Glycine soja TaxID=3848 RepID=A0A0B2QX23_GLYSO|nr:Anaphase-promoting complex subunit 11 [Glycine soja]